MLNLGRRRTFLHQTIPPQLADGAKRPPRLSPRWVNKMEPAALKGLFRNGEPAEYDGPLSTVMLLLDMHYH